MSNPAQLKTGWYLSRSLLVPLETSQATHTSLTCPKVPLKGLLKCSQQPIPAQIIPQMDSK